MSEINMNKDGFYGSGGGMGATPIGGGICGTGIGGSGGGGGVGSIWGKLTLLERNQDKILSRLNQLESDRDAKSEPESLPIGHSLSKEQISDKLIFNKQREIEELKTKIADKHKLLEDVMNQRDRYKNQMNAKQKVLEDVIDQRDRYLKQIYELSKQLEDVKKDNEYSSGTLKNYEDRVEELDQENKDLKWTVNQQAASINNLYTKNKELEKDVEYWKKLVDVTEENKHKKYHDLLAVAEKLEKDKEFWVERAEKLQMENGDLRWGFDHPALVEQQAARECYMIIEKIKNDPLTCGEGKKWMVAVCQDVQRAIEKEFDLNG